MRSVSERLHRRRHEEQHATSVMVNMPDDVVEDLKEVAMLRGYSSMEALLRTYIGTGLRKDMERLDGSPLVRLAEGLRKKGLSEAAIADVLAEADLKIA